MRGLTVSGATLFTSADLRSATLSDASFVRAGDRVDFTRAFLTCADLRDADLGQANLRYADLTGADLRSADLSRVRGLTPAQVRHAVTDGRTRWPRGFLFEPGAPWRGNDCRAHARRMTGMLGGQGYDPAVACPVVGQPVRIATVCKARQELATQS